LILFLKRTGIPSATPFVSKHKFSTEIYLHRLPPIQFLK